jgi:hypothetical protein
MTRNAVVRRLPIVVIQLYAGGMAIFFAITGASAPPGNGVIPAALAFVTISLLGAAVTWTMDAQERRIQELERQLAQRNEAAEAVRQAQPPSSIG